MKTAMCCTKRSGCLIEDLLKFRGGLLATSCCKVRLAAHIDGIESSEFGEERCTRHREVVWNRGFQSHDRVQRRPSSECRKSVQRGKIFEQYGRILGKPFLQTCRKPEGFRTIAG